jgi:PAS domain S-box-containing protein
MAAQKTSRENQRCRLSDEGEDFRTRLIEGSPDCIKVLDLDGRLLSMNAGGMKVLEICDFTPLIGASWIEMWKGANREAAELAVKTARAGGVGRFVGFFPTTQTQRPKWFDVMISPICDAAGRPEKLLATSRDVTNWKRNELLLHAIIEGTSAVTGREFFVALVQHLADGLGVRYSFVAECLPDARARSLAFWSGGAAGADFEYELRGTPCLEVTEGRTCHFRRDLQKLFSDDRTLAEWRAESYLGVPVRDSERRVIGHLVIMDDKPLAADPRVVSVMEAFASRAGLELERAHAFQKMQHEKEVSDERFRDLFDEAPIAYVLERLDTRFVRANRTAMRILGITPEQVEGTYGRTFIPETPEAQERLRAALESIGRGTDTSGVVLELRRRDNGKPIFIQWWSRPELKTGLTRTMFIDITDRVLMEREKARIEAQNSYLREEISSQHNFDAIVGNSPALLDVLRQVDRVAATDATVLVCGETGTGKELIARALHDRSPRRGRPLVKVNCGAISAGLVESELFGHVKGAFTGAIANRDGRFTLADGGTIFLDEVGELPPETQVKLLRVLQEQEFEPIGSSKTVKVDVRVIAATNRDLAAAVREGRFRSDLFYRLNVVPLTVPPLRDRVDDIPLLTMFFVEKLGPKLGRPIKEVAPETMARLCRYAWPGNVRELQNVIERTLILRPGPVLDLFDLPDPDPGVGPDMAEPPGPPDPRAPADTTLLLRVVLARLERETILEALKRARGVRKEAARLLGVDQRNLAYYFRKHDLDPD